MVPPLILLLTLAANASKTEILDQLADNNIGGLISKMQRT